MCLVTVCNSKCRMKPGNGREKVLLNKKMCLPCTGLSVQNLSESKQELSSCMALFLMSESLQVLRRARGGGKYTPWELDGDCNVAVKGNKHRGGGGKKAEGELLYASSCL